MRCFTRLLTSSGIDDCLNQFCPQVFYLEWPTMPDNVGNRDISRVAYEVTVRFDVSCHLLVEWSSLKSVARHHGPRSPVQCSSNVIPSASQQGKSPARMSSCNVPTSVISTRRSFPVNFAERLCDVATCVIATASHVAC